MKKAFTMIELVFVIVVIGILAGAILPSTRTNPNAEASLKLISDIRYTQHLALVNDKIDPSNASWFKEHWNISFNGSTYSIMSDGVYAINPLSKEDLKDVDLKIDSLALSGSCAGESFISFDHLGRPFKGDPLAFTSAYPNNKLLQTPCILTLSHSNENDIVLTLFPETGYIKR